MKIKHTLSFRSLITVRTRASPVRQSLNPSLDSTRLSLAAMCFRILESQVVADLNLVQDCS